MEIPDRLRHLFRGLVSQLPEDHPDRADAVAALGDPEPAVADAVAASEPEVAEPAVAEPEQPAEPEPEAEPVLAVPPAAAPEPLSGSALNMAIMAHPAVVAAMSAARTELVGQ